MLVFHIYRQSFYRPLAKNTDALNVCTVSFFWVSEQHHYIRIYCQNSPRITIYITVGRVVSPVSIPRYLWPKWEKIKADFFFEETSSLANYENLSILKISWCHAFGLSCSRIHRFCTGGKASFKVGLKGIMTPYPPIPFKPTLTPF
jgi:hypothetical protein